MYNPRHPVDCTCPQCKWWWSPQVEEETKDSMVTVSHTFEIPCPLAIPPMSILISTSSVVVVKQTLASIIQGGD